MNLTASVGGFPPVSLVFAWTQVVSVPLILGQLSFFLEFDVCFFRKRAVFEIARKGGSDDGATHVSREPKDS